MIYDMLVRYRVVLWGTDEGIPKCLKQSSIRPGGCEGNGGFKKIMVVNSGQNMMETASFNKRLCVAPLVENNTAGSYTAADQSVGPGSHCCRRIIVFAGREGISRVKSSANRGLMQFGL